MDSHEVEPTMVVEEEQELPHFLRLPPELRNIVYELLVPPNHTGSPYCLRQGHLKPPILNVNRQLRFECAPVFYHNNTFQFSNPEICFTWLVGMPLKYREMILEIRYDCSETCNDPRSWRRAFLDLPGMNEDDKLGRLKNRLAEKGVFLQYDALKVGIRINGAVVWTHDPLAEARDAVQRGALVGRMMFV